MTWKMKSNKAMAEYRLIYFSHRTNQYEIEAITQYVETDSMENLQSIQTLEPITIHSADVVLLTKPRFKILKDRQGLAAGCRTSIEIVDKLNGEEHE